ncbi:hypothetical protein [Pseudarthrobacter sulfonivorans]|uniref:hypothetical protein n=1 Tax=Pseudarthrobacter sulfonivorans TaxID=121292 RepID=UPI002786290D|nr:hypothetical protein [Pseudarthrobacter sulfonivorans]MDP9998437.1 enoyl-CoA hydratase/carnithine racemase [Pseudarthrobacter sulfonivorans]
MTAPSGRGNSWTRMNAEYRWFMGTLDNDPSVCVIVVTGTGRQFCVGAEAKALDFHAGNAENHARHRHLRGMPGPDPA